MKSNVSVALMYYGYPADVSEMREYLKDIMNGRDPPQWLIDENIKKLQMIGGETPSIKTVNNIRDKLESRLDLKVHLLTKHYRPNIKDAARMINDQIIIEVPLFPIYSKQIFDSYYIPFENSLKGRNFIRIENIGFHPLIIDYYRKILEKRNEFILFSSHSLPVRGYDPYPKLLVDNMKLISPLRKYMWFYHSQGPFGGKWIGPDMDYIVSRLTEMGIKEVIDVPIGFLYEHIEVLYDLDILFKEKLFSKGIRYERIKPVSDGNETLDAISQLILEKLDRI